MLPQFEAAEVVAQPGRFRGLELRAECVQQHGQ
jgi:hypothetical protein